jgi:hypothetical protein
MKISSTIRERSHQGQETAADLLWLGLNEIERHDAKIVCLLQRMTHFGNSKIPITQGYRQSLETISRLAYPHGMYTTGMLDEKGKPGIARTQMSAEVAELARRRGRAGGQALVRAQGK